MECKAEMNLKIGLIAAFLAGSLGGLLANLFTSRRPQAATPHVLRANRFELVDESGKLRGVIDCEGVKQPPIRMLGSDGHIAVDIGVVPTGSSYLILNGADGSSRVAFKMGFGDKPVLIMGDRTSPTKLVLGSVNSDFPDPKSDTWALEFNQPPPHHRTLAGINALLGTEGKPIGGHVFVVDTRGRLLALGGTDSH
jgi:hypothetical protein